MSTGQPEWLGYLSSLAAAVAGGEGPPSPAKATLTVELGEWKGDDHGEGRAARRGRGASAVARIQGRVDTRGTLSRTTRPPDGY